MFKKLLFSMMLFLTISLFFTSCIGFLFSPSTPGNLQPSSGAKNVPIPVNFSWSASTVPFGGQIYYDFYFGTTSGAPLLAKNLTKTSYTVNNLTPGTKYYWRVVAKNGDDKSTSSFENSFTTQTLSVHRGLTVGLTTYDHQSDLAAADDDSDEIKITFENLKENYSIQKETGRILKNQVQAWLSAYVPLSQAGDVFVFHYAGHGEYSANESKMVMSDDTRISMRDLRSYLDTINGTKIVLIDACQSGDFTNLTPGKEPSTEQRMEQARLFNEGVFEAFQEDETSRGNYNTEHEYYVLTGAAINQSSYEDKVLNHGFFSFFLNDGLGNVGAANPNDSYDSTFNADGYGTGGVADQKLTLREVYNYTKDSIHSYMKDTRQTVQTNYPLSDYIIGTY